MPAAFAADIEFHKLLAHAGDISLERLMLEFAADAYPQLDTSACTAELDRLGELARRRLDRLGDLASLVDRLREISHLLYRDEGFRGNREAYYDPRNSYLNEVLSRRTGIPISLGMVYLCVAARAGLPVYGVSTPGHFVLGCEELGETWYIDPFNNGDVLDFDDCRDRLEQINGELGSLTWEHFRPASEMEMAVRVLRNLKAAYALSNRWNEMLPVQRRIVLLLPEAIDESRDLGLVLLRTGNVQPAYKLLLAYAHEADAEQALAVDPYLRAARRMMAELN